MLKVSQNGEKMHPKVGVSTSSFYPLHTEEALSRLGRAGVRRTELFFNAACELEEPFVEGLRETALRYGVEVVSVHPFTSGFEPFLLFSGYERRFEDGRRFYERYFRAARRLGAPLLVLHGDRRDSPLPEEEYFRRFGILSDDARCWGVTLAQENVPRCRCREPEFVKRMSRALGEKAAFVLDLKQALRAGTDAFSMAEAMGDRLVHIHVSDCGPMGDCLAPGAGCFDFVRLQEQVCRFGYCGSWIIELYRESYGGEEELFQSLSFLRSRLSEK